MCQLCRQTLAWVEWASKGIIFLVRKRFKKLLILVEKKVKKAERGFNNAKKSAQEIAASAALSPSQSGDMYHSQGAVDTAKRKLDSIMLLKKELEEKGEDVCFDYEDEEVFVVDNPVLISGISLVSTKSPLGKKILKTK